MLILAYLAFASLGLPDGLVGVTWPSLRAFFGVPQEALGLLVLSTTTGYASSSFCAGPLIGRLGVGGLLTASGVTTAASLSGYAAAPAWPFVLPCAVLAGLGAGAIDAAINAWAAERFDARVLNRLHACYGVGAASGPAVMTAVLLAGRPWQHGYQVVAAVELVLAAAFAVTARRWIAVPTASDAPPARPALLRHTLAKPGVWLGMLAFLLYTGLEAAFGAWTYSLLTASRGISMAAGGAWASAFWLGLAVGRFLLGGVLASRANIPALLRMSVLAIAAGAALLATDAVPPLTGPIVFVIGLACGPVFPSLISTTAERVGEEHGANAVGLQISAAAVGQAALPAATGVVAAGLGLEAIGIAFFAASLALVAVEESMAASGTRTPTRPETRSATWEAPRGLPVDPDT